MVHVGSKFRVNVLFESLRVHRESTELLVVFDFLNFFYVESKRLRVLDLLLQIQISLMNNSWKVTVIKRV